MTSRALITARNAGDQVKFEGEVTIVGKTFSYVLECQVPISHYMVVARNKTTAEMRQIIHITLRSDEGEISLTDREWEIFYYAVFPSALRIHNARVTRGVSAETHSAALVEGGEIYLKPHACTLLAQPKFGCQFLDPTVDPSKKSH